MPVKGGNRLKRKLRQWRAGVEQQPRAVTVGYHDRVMASLAALHEFGSDKQSIPERPAFRAGVEDARQAGRAELRKVTDEGLITHNGAERVGDAMRSALIASYKTFHGPGLAESTVRKHGRDKELKGAGDFKMASSISVVVED